MMKNKQPLFTICIPVFKVEKYISLAIKDLLSQTFDDFECILIDDKSPDDSIKVAEEIIGDDSRFTILKNRKNLGVSRTRNKGLAKARGEYIIFLDSDDRYDNRLLGNIVNQIKITTDNGEKPDVLTWEFGGVGEDNEKIKRLESWRASEIYQYGKPKGKYDPVDFADNIFQINVGNMCMKCFRVEHLKLNKIKFNENIKFNEDGLFSYQAIFLSRNVVALPGDNILYYYRRDQPDSAMHTIDFAEQVGFQLEVILEMEKLLVQNDIFDVYSDSFKKWVYDGIGSVMGRTNRMHDQRMDEINAEIDSIRRSRSWRLAKLVRRILRKRD